MKIKYRIWISTLTLALLPSACLLEDAFSPEGPRSAGYFLEKANGASLPVVLSASATERNVLLSESLYFDGSGTVNRTFAIRRELVETGQSTTSVYTLTASYKKIGSRLEFGLFSPCPPNALCAADTGVFRVGKLFVTSNVFGNNARELEYERAGEV